MLNVAVEMGRLVATPELKHTKPGGVSFTRFTIAVDRDYKPEGKDRETDFIDIVSWRGTAEYVCKYFQKGQMIAVKGSIQTRSYTDTNGEKRKVFEIVADEADFAGSYEKKESTVNAEQ